MATDLALVDAKDSSNQASVNIRVKRNTNVPVFREDFTEETINQDHQINDTIITLSTRDRDDRVRKSHKTIKYIVNIYLHIYIVLHCTTLAIHINDDVFLEFLFLHFCSTLFSTFVSLRLTM